MTDTQVDPVRDPTGLFEKLLELGWPGRKVVVTPAPFDPVEAAPRDDPRSYYVVDVLIGPHPDDASIITFRVSVENWLKRQDWLGAAAIVFATAKLRESLTCPLRTPD